ncbi:O-antigen ligase family protein [Nitrosospira briensis]|uniref:O-antigen ligase family protein n=1 Tax=Nitrosospira briensis TaxID=35799 RepID=UPI00046A5629|nr:O-antigen ligase family protein [Nitrosospira briensis]
MSTPASSPGLTQSILTWRDALAKFALLFFGVALWYKGLSFYAYYLLPVAWVLDGGMRRFGEIIYEPLIGALLVLCLVLAFGILWSDSSTLGFKVWRRYFAFLVFIPYLGLLNKARLPWAIGGLLIGYLGALVMGVYQWVVLGVQGIPPLGMPYLHFSSMLGIGTILSLYFAGMNRNKKTKTILWCLAVFLLFLQFNQNARGILAATLISSALLLLLLHKKEIRTLFALTVSLTIILGVFASSSISFQERLVQARHDIELSTQGRYDTSLGYRIAIWDVGLHGIAESPFFGHGTGMAASYFDRTIETYKGGLYKELPNFIPTTYHYHNDWIEIGMQIGALGLMAYAYFLWSWFQTFKAHQLKILGTALVSFVFLSGLTDNLVFFRQTFYLLLIITAIGIGWHTAYTAGFTQAKELQ